MATLQRSTLSASTLIGDEVRNAAGEGLGSIKDIMLDVGSGRIAYAVLSFGGFLGLGDKLFAIPWNALQLHPEDHAFILNVDQQTLKDAEGFDQNDWPDMSDAAWGKRIHDYYGTQPYWD